MSEGKSTVTQLKLFDDTEMETPAIPSPIRKTERRKKQPALMDECGMCGRRVSEDDLEMYFGRCRTCFQGFIDKG